MQQSGIEIAVCCQHQLFKHILDKVRYDFFAAAGGGFKQRCRAAGHGISGGRLRWWKCRRFRRPNFRPGRLRTRPTRRQLKHGSRKVDWNWEIHQQDLKKNANFSKQILKSKRAGWKVQHESTCITYISYQKWGDFWPACCLFLGRVVRSFRPLLTFSP